MQNKLSPLIARAWTASLYLAPMIASDAVWAQTACQQCCQSAYEVCASTYDMPLDTCYNNRTTCDNGCPNSCTLNTMLKEHHASRSVR